MRLSRSAPITSTFSARPDSICAVARLSAERNPVHAAPTSIAPARLAPSSSATRGAALGVSSSADMVATRIRSRSVAETPARSSAMSPASAANELRRSSGHAIRLWWTPVRLAIQLASIPSRSAISALGTERSGTHMDTDAIPAPRRAPSRVAVGAGTGRLAISGMCHLRLREDAGLNIRERAANQALQDLARPDLHEPLRAAVPQRVQRLAPAHRAHERQGQLLLDVFERARGHAREDRDCRRADRDGPKGILQIRQRRGHPPGGGGGGGPP